SGSRSRVGSRSAWPRSRPPAAADVRRPAGPRRGPWGGVVAAARLAVPRGAEALVGVPQIELDREVDASIDLAVDPADPLFEAGLDVVVDVHGALHDVLGRPRDAVHHVAAERRQVTERAGQGEGDLLRPRLTGRRIVEIVE